MTNANIELTETTSVYMFFRAEGWYPIELYGDQDAIANALCNEGTIKVTDRDGNIIWTAHPTDNANLIDVTVEGFGVEI